MAKKRTTRKSTSKKSKPSGRRLANSTQELSIDDAKEYTSPDIKSLWVDSMSVLKRTDAPVATLRFYAFVPPSMKVEVARLQMVHEHARAMADVLSSHFAEEAEPGKS